MFPTSSLRISGCFSMLGIVLSCFIGQLYAAISIRYSIFPFLVEIINLKCPRVRRFLAFLLKHGLHLYMSIQCIVLIFIFQEDTVV